MIEPIKSTLSADAIRQYGEKVGIHHKIYDNSGQADLEGLFFKLGGSFRPKDESVYFAVEEPGRFSLSLPSLISRRRQRFMIGQALGFYFLHYLYPGVTSYVKFAFSELDESIIIQANQFVSALAMTPVAFNQSFAEHGGDDDWEWKLADRFSVSPASVRVRAQILELAGATV